MYKYLLTLASAALLGTPASAVTIDWVTVGDPGNACDPQSQGCFGAVDYEYRIGKYEVANAQYTEFLNTVDPTGANTLALYNADMGPFGIDFVAGNAAGSKYVVKDGFANKPARINDLSRTSYIPFYSALRFANWLHNGQGGGSTETGAYTLLGGTPIPSNGYTVTRNAGATIFLTSEDEWYKAAYYDASTLSYNPYPFADGFNGVACEAPAGTTSHSANCDSAVDAPSDVGAYTSSPSEYGTFDQGGNLYEWNEAILVPAEGTRGLRGGSFDSSGASRIAASQRISTYPLDLLDISIGFRVASIPEPTTALLLACGLVGLGVRRRLR